MALKMGAKRVSIPLGWKSCCERESNGTSVAANYLFNSFGPFSVHKLSIEKLCFSFFFVLNLLINLQRGGRLM